MKGIYTADLSALLDQIDQHPGAIIIAPGRAEIEALQSLRPNREYTHPLAICRRLGVHRKSVAFQDRDAYLRSHDFTGELIATRQWALQQSCFSSLPQETQEALQAYRQWLGEHGVAEFEDCIEQALASAGIIYGHSVAVEAQQYGPLTRRLIETVCGTCTYVGDPAATYRVRYGAGGLDYEGLPKEPAQVSCCACRTYSSPSALAQQVAREIAAAWFHREIGTQYGLVVRGAAERPYLLEALRNAGIPTSSQSLLDSLETPVARTIRSCLKWMARPQVSLMLRGDDAPQARAFRLTTHEFEALLTSPWVSWSLDEIREHLAAGRHGPDTDIGSGLNRQALSTEELEDEGQMDDLLWRMKDLPLPRLDSTDDNEAPNRYAQVLQTWMQATPEWQRLGERTDVEARQLLASAEAIYRFLHETGGSVIDALTKLSNQKELEEPEYAFTGLQPDTLHLLRPAQVIIGTYHRLWVTGLSEGNWPKPPSAALLRERAKLRGSSPAQMRREHLEAEAALWRVTQRGFPADGSLSLHTYLPRDATRSRFVSGLQDSARSDAEFVSAVEYGAWLERQARLSPRSPDPYATRCARALAYSRQRADYPGPSFLETPSEPNRAIWDDTLRLSASQLDSRNACPQKYVYQYVYRLKSEDDDGYLGFGSLVHQLLEEAFTFTLPEWNGEGALPTVGMPVNWLDRDGWLATRLYRHATSGEYAFEGHYRALGLERRLKAHRFVTSVLAAAPPEPEYNVLAAEHHFDFALNGLDGKTACLSGVIDRIDRIDRVAGDNAGSRIKLWDYKTGNRPDNLAIKTAITVQERVQEMLQLATYCLAAEQVDSLKALGEVREIEYCYLPEREVGYAGVVRAAAPPPPPGQARAAVLVIAQAIMAEDFTTMLQKDLPCRNCDFKPICPRHDGPVEEA